ncbi:MAG: pbpF 3, partial [Sporomusa sp.]|nr:pbpF 3 [Sporomusa sp.]
DMNAAVNRRAVVLAGLVKESYITEQQAAVANREPVQLAGKKKRAIQASYFLDYIANELVGRYGANRVYKGGLKVYTTLDTKTQQAAEAVLGEFQGAVLALDARTGYIRAMVGGRNYEESQTNRVLSEIRQPGSAFKPILYAAALNSGLTAASVIVDEPINISGYVPQNYDKKYRGSITLKKAVRWSVNVAAVKVGQQIGMENVLNLARSMGISTIVPEDNNLASALGGLTQGVSLFELTTAYTGFANGGVISKPVAIVKVLDENDRVLEQSQLSQQTALQPDVAYIITDILKSVLDNGTGTPANLGRPAAGKTGTTDNYETAWFMGYTPELVVGIYIGNDNRKPVGISGTEVSALWGTMMSKVVSDSRAIDFSVPPNVITKLAICAESGKLAPSSGCSDIEYSAFIRGTEPKVTDSRTRGGQSAPSNNQRDNRPFWKLPWRLPGF